MSSTAVAEAVYRCAQCGSFARQRELCSSCGAPLHPGEYQPVSLEAFKLAVARSPVPVIVDLYSPTCPTCRSSTAALLEFARREAGHMVVLALDADANPQLGEELEAFLYPSFFVYRSGTEVSRTGGPHSAEELVLWAERA